ncbi:MAG: hypothetical protein ACREPS_08705 [Rhodanobacteraceae bacterium]
MLLSVAWVGGIAIPAMVFAAWRLALRPPLWRTARLLIRAIGLAGMRR